MVFEKKQIIEYTWRSNEVDKTDDVCMSTLDDVALSTVLHAPHDCFSGTLETSLYVNEEEIIFEGEWKRTTINKE